MYVSQEKKENICHNCIYGNQPYGYYPVVCVYDAKHIKELWHDKFKCKHFEECPVEPPKQEPFKIVKCYDK